MKWLVTICLWILVFVRWLGKKLRLELLVLAFTFASCAKTEFFYQGQRVARFEADMARVRYSMKIEPQGVTITWSADAVSHSEATRAQGEASASKIAAGASLITAAGTAAALIAK